MAQSMKRAVIVGASTSLGKELAEVLSSSAQAWDVTLAEAGAAGRLTSAGEEATLMESVEAVEFDPADVVFFTGDAETTRTWMARVMASKAVVVDCSGALDEATKFAPGFTAAATVKGKRLLRPVHPAAWLLAMLQAGTKAQKLVATVLLPASALGDAAMDELHAQTVALLSFQSQPREVFDTQVAFTVSERVGAEAKLRLQDVRASIVAECNSLLPQNTLMAMDMVLAPVFHGLTVSAYAMLPPGHGEVDVSGSLELVGFTLVTDEDEKGLSNQSVVGENLPAVRVRTSGEGSAWLWTGMDNVRWSATAGEAAAMASMGVLVQ